MPCFAPIPAYQECEGADVKLRPRLGAENMSVPCGQCLGCKAMRASHWVRRIMHEAKSHEENWFATLTYSDEFLPRDYSLNPRHVQLFFKRLRKAGYKVRYYAVGEYGSQTFRPHYHAILFGIHLTDAKPAGAELYSSAVLDELWSFGAVRLGTVTAHSAAYVAGYSLKAAQGRSVCDQDGVVMEPPFSRMSRKPGIGHLWLDRYREDLKHGYVIDDGKKVPVPRAYVERLRRTDDDLAAVIRARKFEAMCGIPTEARSEARRSAAEAIATQRLVESKRKGKL